MSHRSVQLQSTEMQNHHFTAKHTNELQAQNSPHIGQRFNPSNMLDDSCWTDLPDLNLSSSAGLASDLCSEDAPQMAFNPIDHLPCMFDLNDTDLLSPEQLDSTLFQDHSDSLGDMDLESILADHDRMLGLSSAKQLQPTTPLAPEHFHDDGRQQLYCGVTRSAALRDTEHPGSQSQESAAVVCLSAKLRCMWLTICLAPSRNP